MISFREESFGAPRGIARFLGNREGGVLLELAFALPVILLILLGCFDTARYVLLHQKMSRAATTMADLVSRPTSISASDVDTMFSAASGLLDPYSLEDNGSVIVSSV